MIWNEALNHSSAKIIDNVMPKKVFELDQKSYEKMKDRVTNDLLNEHLSLNTRRSNFRFR
jgi:hypothetical protein